MKKIISGLLILTFLFSISFQIAAAATETKIDFVAFIEKMILIGVIGPDKAEMARAIARIANSQGTMVKNTTSAKETQATVLASLNSAARTYIENVSVSNTRNNSSYYSPSTYFKNVPTVSNVTATSPAELSNFNNNLVSYYTSNNSSFGIGSGVTGVSANNYVSNNNASSNLTESEMNGADVNALLGITATNSTAALPSSLSSSTANLATSTWSTNSSTSTTGVINVVDLDKMRADGNEFLKVYTASLFKETSDGMIRNTGGEVSATSTLATSSLPEISPADSSALSGGGGSMGGSFNSGIMGFLGNFLFGGTIKKTLPCLNAAQINDLSKSFFPQAKGAPPAPDPAGVIANGPLYVQMEGATLSGGTNGNTLDLVYIPGVSTMFPPIHELFIDGNDAPPQQVTMVPGMPLLGWGMPNVFPQFMCATCLMRVKKGSVLGCFYKTKIILLYMINPFGF